MQITKQDKLNDMSAVCVMSDMIRFEDMDKDGRLGLNEFYAAFSKLYSKCLQTIKANSNATSTIDENLICLRRTILHSENALISAVTS